MAWPQWFTNHEKGALKQELASIYHYYLHPENCPDGILRYALFVLESPVYNIRRGDLALPSFNLEDRDLDAAVL